MPTLISRAHGACWAVVLFVVLAAVGIARQANLAAEAEMPRHRAVVSLLKEAAADHQTMESREPVARLVDAIAWAGNGDLAWLRIEWPGSGATVERGGGNDFRALPASWRATCRQAADPLSLYSWDSAVYMAGAEARPGTDDSGYCLWVGFSRKAAQQYLWQRIDASWPIVLLLALFVAGMWLLARPVEAWLSLGAALFTLLFVCEIDNQHGLEQRLIAETRAGAKLAAIDLKLAELYEIPLPVALQQSERALSDHVRRNALLASLAVTSGAQRYASARTEQGEPDTATVGSVAISYDKETVRLEADARQDWRRAGRAHMWAGVVLLVGAAVAAAMFLSAALDERLGEPTPGRSYRPLLGATLFFLGAEELLRPVLLAILRQRIDTPFSPAETDAVGMLALWVPVLFGLRSGVRWATRMAPERLFLAGVIVAAAGLCGQLLAGSLLPFVLARALEGAAYGTAYAAALQLALRIEEPVARRTFAAQTALGGIVAGILGAPIGGFVAALAGTSAVIALAIAAALMAVLCALRLPRGEPLPAPAIEPAVTGQTGALPAAVDVRAVALAARWAWFGVAAVMIPAAALAAPLDAAVAGELLGLTALAMFAGRVVLARIRPLPLQIAWAGMLASALLAGAAWLSAAPAWAWAAVALLAGLAIAMAMQSIQDLIERQQAWPPGRRHWVWDRAGALAGVAAFPVFVALPPSAAVAAIILLLLGGAWFARFWR